MTGWTVVEREVQINYDLENSPLQIWTNSEIGRNEVVKVWFFNAQGFSAGGLVLSFTSPPQYWLGYCSSSYNNFPTALPSETDKVWTITLTRSSGAPSVVMHCNNKEVLNVVLSDSTCSNSNWRDYWSKDVEKIIFDSSDTVSDYYRPGKVMTSRVFENHSDREVYLVQINCTF